MTTIDATPIRKLNDRFRMQMDHTLGKWVTTKGVNDLGALFVQRVCRSIQQFTEFSENNDPHGEHDFGKIDLDGQTVFWKIDYFEDKDCEFGSEDASDAAKSYRVLTVLLSSEY